MSTEEDTKERLKSALWYYVGKTVDEKCLTSNRNATPQFIGALTELVWAQIENVAIDLESFAHHARRETVTTDDVFLLARKNPDLQQLMRDFIAELPRQDGRQRLPGAAKKSKGKDVATRISQR
ncbi:Putative Apoptosis-inducing TAF9-like domain 1 family protein [[Torrubiella] hemipterigena]|uniref:Putative Apoptosis-inducing TAF9-like domain 1 family protein n=1 Tax=[Torrubiella] hemipterigena TaxID=1531966 RepID=A0A0A1T499_9HYPO|nr:Putative Apoptosis-inducing TAF9-like domain 1 family protein [[Torrubiella] hemipterigena]